MDIELQNENRIKELHSMITSDIEEKKQEIEGLLTKGSNPTSNLEATVKLLALLQQADYFERTKQLGITCEIGIREIISKYLKGRELDADDIERIINYFQYSKVDISDQSVLCGAFMIKLYRYGSGEFTPEEIEILTKISNIVIKRR